MHHVMYFNDFRSFPSILLGLIFVNGSLLSGFPAPFRIGNRLKRCKTKNAHKTLNGQGTPNLRLSSFSDRAVKVKADPLVTTRITFAFCSPLQARSIATAARRASTATATTASARTASAPPAATATSREGRTPDDIS